RVAANEIDQLLDFLSRRPAIRVDHRRAKGTSKPTRPANLQDDNHRDAAPGVARMLRAMGSSFGALFRITTFGESHGPALGVVIDGCPPRLRLDLAQIQAELDRRRPGQSRLVSQRKETDRVEILSGVLDGVTLGTPIAMVIHNQDARG